MFELRIIYKLGKPYLKRWRIFGYLSASNSKAEGLMSDGEIPSKLPFALRIHRFFQRDEDLCPHNHPWKWAISFIFWGGYGERIWKKDGTVIDRFLKAPAINFIRHEDYHMVTSLDGNPITLFLTGPKTSSWGFLVNGVNIDWEEFLGIKKDSNGSNGSDKKTTGGNRYDK